MIASLFDIKSPKPVDLFSLMNRLLHSLAWYLHQSISSPGLPKDDALWRVLLYWKSSFKPRVSTPATVPGHLHRCNPHLPTTCVYFFSPPWALNCLWFFFFLFFINKLRRGGGRGELCRSVISVLHRMKQAVVGMRAGLSWESSRLVGACLEFGWGFITSE